MSSAKTSLADDVLARVEVKKTCLSWFDRLPADVQAETLDLRKRLSEGAIAIPPTALARAMVEAYTERGYVMPRIRQVREWLTGKPH